jgi:hypothetical protein
MATAANVVKFKRSAVPGKVPATTDLNLGEIALNTYDGRVYLKKSVASTESIVTLQQYSGGTGVAVSVDGVISIGQSVATTANVTFATGVFRDTSAGSNYTVKIGNATGSVFGIGTGSNSFGIANDALNNAQTGYVPYQVTATQVGFKTSANNYLWSFNADGTTQFPNYKFPADSGTTGQVLASNGDGTASWVTTSATSSGTVTSVSVVNTNGFTATVATASSTPAITLKTTVNGLLKGNSTTGVVSAATAGTDYLTPSDITSLATQTYVTTAINNLINGSVSALDTLKELADAIGNDANFAATVTTALANRVRYDASQTLTDNQQSQARLNIGAISLEDSFVAAIIMG